MLLFWKTIDETQMSKPPECAATFFKTWRLILVSHLGLQSVSLWVETPCIEYKFIYLQTNMENFPGSLDEEYHSRPRKAMEKTH